MHDEHMHWSKVEVCDSLDFTKWNEKSKEPW